MKRSLASHSNIRLSHNRRKLHIPCSSHVGSGRSLEKNRTHILTGESDRIVPCPDGVDTARESVDLRSDNSMPRAFWVAQTEILHDFLDPRDARVAVCDT